MKAQKIKFEQIPEDSAVKLLATETQKRLNENTSKFQFTGYNVRIPGYICILAKLSKNKEMNKQQNQELKQLGYFKVTQEDIEKYQLLPGYGRRLKDGTLYKNTVVREIYAISIEKLLKIHEMKI